MIQAGKNIKQPGDKLFKINIEYLFEKICKPDEKFVSQINRLRTIETLSPEKYRIMKTELPYITCGIFTPEYRKTENFASISYFIIDLDHIHENDFNIMQLKMKLSADDRILMLFSSPSNNGIKLMFRLSEKCFDKNKYSMFYKIFTSNFAKQYGLQKISDMRTSDVTRACFFSMDKDAYFNAKALPVDMNSIINFENPAEVDLAKSIIKESEIEYKEIHKDDKPQEKEIPADIFDIIKRKLNPNIRTSKAKAPVEAVPELDEIMLQVQEKCKLYEIEIKSVRNIQNAKQIQFELNKHFAEINLFFGAKGFSVVKSTKQMCNPELNDIVHKIICEIVF